MERRFHSCDSNGLLALLDLAAGEGPLGRDCELPRTSRNELPQISGYEIVSRLGEGGMGVVWRAIQLSTRRPVALKVMAQLSAPLKSLARFEREVELASRLEHPHIARIYESGIRQGFHYYAMELIEGSCLDRHVRESKLDQRQVLELMRNICLAVHFAHQRGVIHRDLKPSNILVTPDGHPHVLDFGLAKATGETLDVTLTQEGRIAGTPAFMSPEQASGGLEGIDTRSDVYSLGAILYLLLTADTAHDLSGPRNQLIRRVVDADVRRPRSIKKDLDLELEWILLKSLERDATLRYDSAAAFAQDIDRYLQGEPLHASPPSRTYRFRKFARKHRAAIGLVSLVVTLLVSATMISISQAVRATRAETLAVMNMVDVYTMRAVEMPATINGFSPLWFAKAATLAGADPRRVEANLIRLNSWLPEAWTPVAAVTCPRGIEQLHFHPTSSRYLIGTGIDGERDRYCRVVDLAAEKAIELPSGFEDATAAAWTPDGHLLLGNARGSIGLFSFPNLKFIRRWDAHESITVVAASADGLLAAAGAGNKLFAFALDAAADPIGEVHPASITYVDFTPDGGRVFSVASDKQLRCFSLKDEPGGDKKLQLVYGPLLHLLDEFPTHSIPPLFMDDGRVLLTVERVGESRIPAIVKYRDAATGVELANINPPYGIWSMATSSDGQWLAAGAGGGELFDRVGTDVQPMLAPTLAAAFNPTRPLLATVDRTGFLRIFNVSESGEMKETCPPIHTFWIRVLAFSADGQFLAALGEDGNLVIWKMPPDPSTTPNGPTLNYGAKSSWVEFSSDGRFVAPIGMTDLEEGVRTLQVFDVETAKPAGYALQLDAALISAAFSRDGRRIAAATGSNTDVRRLHIWDWQAGRAVCPAYELPAQPAWIAYAPDGQAIAVYCLDGQILLIDPNAGRLILQCSAARPDTSNARNPISFSRDGRTFFTLCSKLFQAWDRATGNVRFTSEESGRFLMLAESADGRLLAAANANGNVCVLDATTGRAVLPTIPHPQVVNGVAFSDDGTRIATVCWDSQVRIFDAATGQQRKTITVPERISSAAFTRDGRAIITTSFYRNAGYGPNTRIWDTETGFPLTRPALATGGYRMKVEISPDGRWAGIGGSPDYAVLLDLPTLISAGQRSPDDALLWCELISNMRVEHSEMVHLSPGEWLSRWRRYRMEHPEFRPFEATSLKRN